MPTLVVGMRIVGKHCYMPTQAWAWHPSNIICRTTRVLPPPKTGATISPLLWERGHEFAICIHSNSMPNIIPRPPLRSEIAGVSIQSLVSQFGTPTFVYDAAVIRQRIAELSAFDYVRYAQKACSNLSILDLIRREGVLVDTVSANEIRRALAAGYTVAGDPPPVVYTADIFDRESLDICVEKRLHVRRRDAAS